MYFDETIAGDLQLLTMHNLIVKISFMITVYC